jgi:spermidine synthase
MQRLPLRRLFLVFFLSGFCSLLYQVVWLRLAYASFGVITPVLSVVVSVFMLGLTLGSWLGGKWIGAFSARFRLSAIWFYALAEFGIGISAFVVPKLFAMGEIFLLRFGETSSTGYLAASAFVLASSMLPWCFLMGTTFPLVMAFVKEMRSEENTGFSFLYLANVIGAMTGTMITAIFLIELLGFRSTLLVAACGNFLITALAVGLGLQYRLVFFAKSGRRAVSKADPSPAQPLGKKKKLAITMLLLITGFTSMGMEVVWTRAFMPVLWTTVYAFASILTVYLLATWLGSAIYRFQVGRGSLISTARLVGALAVSSFLPIVLNDPRMHSSKIVALASIFPFCAVLGYMTPKLIDRYSSGSPEGGGAAYAINVIGCILGPLFASYVLLPFLSVRESLFILAIPFFLFLFLYRVSAGMRRPFFFATAGASAALAVCALFINYSPEEAVVDNLPGGKIMTWIDPQAHIWRDYSATVIATGSGMNKRLLTNGAGMTELSTITKMMAHIPLATFPGQPKNGLVICFGMGTTFRSMLSWGIETTAVELIPSVRDAFPYFHADAAELMKDPKGRVVVDDGRRFLRRTKQKFDVITIDPPPPIKAAGSSLLYSMDFLAEIKGHLSDDGLLMHWFPGGEAVVLNAVARALKNTFPFVIVQRSVEGWGYHFLASKKPITLPATDLFLAKMPLRAKADMMEWIRGMTLESLLTLALKQERLPLDVFLHPNTDVVISDNRPFNEYYLVRRNAGRLREKIFHF